MIQDLSGSWCIKGSNESTVVMDSLAPLMHHDPNRSWITDPDPDHPKGRHPKFARMTDNDLHEVQLATNILYLVVKVVKVSLINKYLLVLGKIHVFPRERHLNCWRHLELNFRSPTLVTEKLKF